MSVNFINSGFFNHKREHADFKLSRKRLLSTNIFTVFDNADEMVIFFNSRLILIYANNSFLRLFNYTPNEIIGKNITNLIFSNDPSVKKSDLLNEIRKQGDNRKYLVRKNDGSAIKCDFKSTIFKYGFDEDFVIQLTGGIFQKEKSLFSQYLSDTSNLEIVLKSFVDFLYIIDKNGYILDFINSQEKNSSNFDKNPIGKKVQDVLHCDYHTESKLIRCIFRAVLQNSNQEIEILDPHSQRTYQLTINPADENYFIIFIKDITHSKIQVYELRKKEELYHNFIDNSSEAILLTDLNGKIFNVNKKALELFKYDNTNEFVNKNIHDFIQSEQKSQIKIIINKIVTQKISLQKELFLMDRDGVQFNGDMNASLLINQENNPYALMIFIKDITDQKKMERELDNSKLLATMGKMTSFITHQIKTPLSAVKMNIDMLESRMELNENEKKSFEIISKEIRRLSGLTKNILIYSKVAEPKFDKVDLFQVIESIRFLLKPLLDRKKITFNNTLCKIEVNGDLVLLQSLFLQIIENSIEAIEQNGLIELSYQENKDDDLSIFIKDNGCGIADCSKIFEPFFTSKSAGTGLGIPIAVKILKQHNGTLNLVSSRKGETIFEVKLKKFFKKH